MGSDPRSRGAGRLSRRALLRRATAAGVGTAFLLNSRGASAGTPTSRFSPSWSGARPSARTGLVASSRRPTATSGDWIPTYQAPVLPPPDFAPTEAGVQAGYISYPSELTRTVNRPVGNGSSVTAMVQIEDVPPTPMDQNTAWQAVNEAVNAEVNFNFIPSSDYNQVSATVIASGDLPDLMFLSRDHIVADLPQVMDALFTDLTPFVSGDNVLEYPNLAALPTSAWVWPSVNQHIYAVPIVRPPFNWMPYINENRWDEVGAAPPTNAQELKEALELLTNPREEQYGFGAIAPHFGLVAGDGMNFLALFGVPHNWAVDSEGRFTKDIETEQFREALAFVRDIYQSGLMYPDANVNLGDLRNLLISGNIGLTFSGHLAFQAFLWPVGQDADPPQEIGYLPWFSANAGDLLFYAYHGVNGFQMIKTADEERVRELLRIMDYMAAPFGSEEYQLTRYGIEGEHFEFNDQGIPELTEQGEEDVMQSVGWEDVATAVAVIGPAEEALVSKMHGYSSEVSQYQIPDGALGYYSATDRESGQTLLDRFHQGIGEIVRGQRDESDLDVLLDEWRSGGGDEMRREYEEAYASAN